MTGLQECTALEEVYLSHNGIMRIEGLEALARLNVLDVSNNRISKIENLQVSLGAGLLPTCTLPCDAPVATLRAYLTLTVTLLALRGAPHVMCCLLVGNCQLSYAHTNTFLMQTRGYIKAGLAARRRQSVASASSPNRPAGHLFCADSGCTHHA